MLKNFLYLNESALSDYLSALEGGLVSSIGDRRRKSRGGHAKAGIAAVGAGGEMSQESEATISMVDTPPAQFERLMRLVAEEPEETGWVEILQPDADLPELLTGALIQLECELEIPAFIKLLSQHTDTLNTLRSIASMSSVFPSAASVDLEKVTIVEQLSGMMNDRLVFVGMLDSDEWKATGQLAAEHLRADVESLEGEVRIVGKIMRKIRSDEQHPLLALPGAGIIGREKRRELAKKGPVSENDPHWLQGPAVVLEVLAIYR